MSLLFTELSQLGVIPVIEIADSSQAIPLAESLAAGGLPVAEITLRTSSALESIALIRKALPDFLVGAGSLLNQNQVQQATAAGAIFGVSPGMTTGLIRATQKLDLPFVPGAASISEILRGIDAGISHFKFFPAEVLGGIATLKAFSAPLAQADVHFMPTGGVSQANAADYLSLPPVFAVGGSWVATKAQILNSQFDEITQSAKTAVELVTSTNTPS